MNALTAQVALLVRHPGVAAVLEVCPGQVYLVGGSVRDLLLGRRSDDIDLAVSGDAERLARYAATRSGHRMVRLGRGPLQVYRLPYPTGNMDLCRIHEAGIEAELARRDLSVNALALPLKPSDSPIRLIDPCGGYIDLVEKRARFVSEANVLADPVRLLRLFRFMATLDLNPHPGSLDLVRKYSKKIQTVPGERLREEWVKLLGAARCHPVVAEMMAYGLLEALVPEMIPLRGCVQGGDHHLDVLQHTLLSLDMMEDLMRAPATVIPRFADDLKAYLENPAYSVLLKTAVLLHDIGKPAVRSEDKLGRVHFHGHERLGVTLVGGIARRLRWSNSETDYICFVIRQHLRPFHLFESYLAGHLTPKGIYRFGRMAGEHLWGLMLHALADASASRGPMQARRGGLPALRDFLDYLTGAVLEQREDIHEASPLINGYELMDALNLKPGPQVGRMMRAIEEARAIGRVRNREQALDLASRLLVV